MSGARRINRAATLSPGLLCLFALACGSSDAAESSENDAGPDDPAIDAGVLPPDPSDLVFESTAIRSYSLTLAQADWDQIQANPRAEEYVPATLDFEGNSYTDVAIRYKGSASSLRNCVDLDGTRHCNKLSFKIKFSEYDPAKRFFGLKRLNFNSNIKDASLVRDRLGYALYNEMGIAAPRTAYARLIVNNEDLGVFSLVEQVDGRFTRRHFSADGGDGNLYKEVWPVYTDEAFFLENLKTNRDQSPSAEKIVRMAADLLAASDETFEATLSSWVDLNSFMNHFALDRAMDHSDGLLIFYCWGGGHYNHNFYWYEDASADHLQLVPWDFDQAFLTPNPNREGGVPEWTVLPSGGSCPTFLNDDVALAGCDPIVARLSTLLWPRFVEAGQRVLDGPFNVELLSAQIDAWALLLAPEVATDSDLDADLWSAEIANLKASLPALRQRFQDELSSQ